MEKDGELYSREREIERERVFHFKKNKRERALYDGYKFEKEAVRKEWGRGRFRLKRGRGLRDGERARKRTAEGKKGVRCNELYRCLIESADSEIPVRKDQE